VREEDRKEGKERENWILVEESILLIKPLL